jgi:hypothetical protein
MDRREFLIRTLRGGSVVLVLPAGWALGGCSSGNSTTMAVETPEAGADAIRFTSDTTGGHTHDFLIAMSTLEQPPSGGVSGDTTVTLNHDHIVSLSQDELAAIQAGQAVSKQTTVVDGHLHTFKFQLPHAQGADGGGAG